MPVGAARYDEIGCAYASDRAGVIRGCEGASSALADSRTIVNVGAGTGFVRTQGPVRDRRRAQRRDGRSAQSRARSHDPR